MEVKEQKDVAANVLKDLKHHVDSDAIIAGGAPRNWDDNNLANDIDIYLRSYAVDTVGMTEGMLSAALGSDVHQTQDVDLTGYDFGKSFIIKKIFAFKHNDVLFQLMFIEPHDVWNKGDLPSKVMRSFDIGLNMIYASWAFLDRKRYLDKTSYYHTDKTNSTLTLYKDNMGDSQIRHCMDKHLPKMQKYYPDHTLIIK